MLAGIYRINYFHFRHRGNAPTDYKQCTGNDVYTYFYCKFYMPNICSAINSEGAMKISTSRASKWAPTWQSCMTTPKSLSGQPLDRVWIRLARKGFWGSHTAMSCGGSFRSSWRADFHGALRFHWHFFRSLDCPLEQCVDGGSGE